MISSIHRTDRWTDRRELSTSNESSLYRMLLKTS